MGAGKLQEFGRIVIANLVKTGVGGWHDGHELGCTFWSG